MFDISKVKELNNTIIECRYSHEDGAFFNLIIHDNMVFTTNSAGREKFVAEISDITKNKEWMYSMPNYSNIEKWYKPFALRILFYVHNETKTHLSSFIDTLSIEYTGLQFRLGIGYKDGSVKKWIGPTGKPIKFDDWC